MSEFTYSGVNKAGKRVTGVISAGNEGELRVQLRSQGIRPTQIKKKSGAVGGLSSLFGGSSTNRASLSIKQLVTLTKQLQVLLSSGVPIVQALEVLSDQASGKSGREILVKIREKVASGSYFNEALALYPKAFPRLYVALVKAGEMTGSTDQMLKRIGKYLEDSERLRRVLKAAFV